ncbi:MAG: HAD-IA family hydrolase [Archangium sp.]|nr:HAD-IA family hydrolase [Archangium sp.]
MSIDALILDLGNVLAFHDNVKLFAEMARTFGTTPEAMKERLDGGLWERVNRGQLPGDSLRVELVQRLGRDIGPKDWFELWNCHFTINEPMVSMVQFLVGQLKLVLLSNTHDQHIAYVRPKLPVLEQFDALVFSCDVGLMKPEKAIYEKALAAAGTAPWKTAFFDDVKSYAIAATQVGVHGRVFTTVEQFQEDLAKLGFKAK